MLRLIIGGVTLAAAGYAVKEYCEEEGCPWDDILYISTENDTKPTNVVIKNSIQSKEFHKFKKNIYKTSMQEYQNFLEKYSIKNSEIETSVKLEKQKLSDAQITDEVTSYMKKISSTLEILSYNLSLGIRILEDDKVPEDEVLKKLNAYANNIYNLCHLKLYDMQQNFNQIEILSSLVNAMGLVTHKESIYVDLKAS